MSERMAEGPHHETTAVVIIAGLWRGFDVAVDPPVATHPLRHCRDHAEALAVAGAIADNEGWPVLDRTAS